MLLRRRTKIVGTIGPASQSPEMLEKLIDAGLNVVRMNFSHGKHEDHLKVLRAVRALSKSKRRPVTVMQDLQGPKHRVGMLQGDQAELKEGETLTITTELILGTAQRFSTDFLELPETVTPGQKVFLDDGNIELQVEAVAGKGVRCRIIHGGILRNRKGMNLPGARFKNLDVMTDKDLIDLKFGLENHVDYVALSFVRDAQDVTRLKALIKAAGSSARVIAKIEMIEALDNLESIVEAADAVMVARGDLGVEVGSSLLPGTQKRIIRVSNQFGKPVITATQMLDSMVNNPRPTRAEVTDIANAVLDGTDAVMLSQETASGKYPVKCVETMSGVCEEVERNGLEYYQMSVSESHTSVAEAIAESACLTAMKLDAQAILCLTTSGKTATLITRFRPRAPVIAVSHVESTLNRLELVWGIHGLPTPPYKTSDEVVTELEDEMKASGLVTTGDKIVLTMGLPLMERGTTNSIRVYTIK